ncbi:GTP-binding protein [Sporothrix brasiliensis 5110]|uniref:GTP-binding protein n=1 Tax=Sporothrix brasiliensis 5110 TaxID=1398154 RepID=A0A0C2IR73_9PEZI|nr:GTP-binding protein [Sporothrix brasiliensis 5110]KIH89390.1 GTP-binding protein [Sporothrix brasiliensis 5110]
MRPADIQLLFERGGPASGFPAHNGSAMSPNGPGELTAAEKAQRVASLQQVLLAVQHYWVTGSPSMDLAAEILGDGSRDASWRIPIGESGLLDFFLGILSVDGLRQSLKIHTLRLIGNSCADEDDNRARVVAGNQIGRIVSLLGDNSTLAFVIPVLYNICVDYEPAQLQAIQAHLSRGLISIVSGPRLAQCRAFLNIVCKLLGLLVANESEVAVADPATPAYLLQLAVSPENALDIEEFSVLVSVALAYLTHEPFQEEIIRQNGVQALLTAYSDSYTKYDVTQMDPEDAADYKALGNRFMHIIADVVALPSFETHYTLSSVPVHILQSWVSNTYTNVHLKTAGCIALGNLARSDQASTYFVQDVKIHLPLIQLLSQPNASLLDLSSDAAVGGISPSSQLVFSALSYLKNLAIPIVNKPVLGTLLDPPANILPRLWTSTNNQPQVQFAAVSLTRLLIMSCPANVRRICAPLSPDPASPAHDRSNLHVLISLFKRSEEENTKTEAARAISAVCRVLHTSSDSDDVLPDDWEPSDETSPHSGSIQTNDSGISSSEPSPNPPSVPAPTSADGDDTAVLDPSSLPNSSARIRRARFYSAHIDMADCLTYLITQTRFPVLRSDTWFVSAVLSRSTDGAHLVMRALQPFEACRALVEAVSGRDLVEGHRLPGGASLLSDDELLTMTDSTGAPVSLPSASEQDKLSDSAGAIAAETPSSSAANIDGLGLEPQQADPAQVASMARTDRENGLVLIAEIMKSYAHFLPPFRRGVLEQLLQTGGALVVSARSEQSEDLAT